VDQKPKLTSQSTRSDFRLSEKYLGLGCLCRNSICGSMYDGNMKLRNLSVILIATAFLSGQAAFAAAPKSLPVISLSSSSQTTFNKPGLLSTSAGWGSPESGGTWTVQDNASLKVSFPKFSKLAIVSLTSLGFINTKNSKVTLQIFINSSLASTVIYNSAFNGGTRDFSVPVAMLKSGFSNVPVSLVILGAASPKSLGLGSDKRKLGVYFIQMAIKSAN